MATCTFLKRRRNLTFGCSQSNWVGRSHDISVRMMQLGWLPNDIRLQITRLDLFVTAIAFEDNVDTVW